jgi:hypothetical protein
MEHQVQTPEAPVTDEVFTETQVAAAEVVRVRKYTATRMYQLLMAMAGAFVLFVVAYFNEADVALWFGVGLFLAAFALALDAVRLRSKADGLDPQLSSTP